MNYAIVTAAGKGNRFGGNKALHPLRGRPLLAWAVSNFEKHHSVGEIVVTVPPDQETAARFREICGIENFTKVRFVTGGETRYHSVRNAVFSIQDANGILLIHDAARPLLSMTLLESVLEATTQYGAVVPVVPVSETVKEVQKGSVVRTVSREHLFLAQTPQGFRMDILASAYSKIEDATVTDEAMLVELAGYEVHVVSGEKRNIKITEGPDIRIAESFL
jgi:2-C-methyl-D-erythritol 4-phosphate cytidylyltransferase